MWSAVTCVGATKANRWELILSLEPWCVAGPCRMRRGVRKDS